MYSSFKIAKSECMICNNEVLKQLGTLQGVFGAEIDRSGGTVLVNHTDEINRMLIEQKLNELGWKVIETENQRNNEVYDEPSIWGCAL